MFLYIITCVICTIDRFGAKDKRNFLRNPPNGVQFNFDYESNFLVGMVMLEEDPNLKEMRFKIVPKEYVLIFLNLLT